MSLRRGTPKPLLVLAASAAITLIAPAGASAITADSQPSISGGSNPPYETETLTANDGSYSFSNAAEALTGGTITTSPEWLRCDSNGDNCLGTGDTDSQYELAQADVGSTIRRQEQAGCSTNICSPTSGISAPTGVVREASPAVTVQDPTRSGSQGRTVMAQETHTGKPTVTISRQWLRCDDGTLASCSSISGATQSEYKLVTADIGKQIRLRATASNSAGPDATDTSDPTQVIAANPPSVTTPPAVSGAATHGTTLNSTQGSFGGEQPITVLGRAWARCSGTTVASCSTIPGATGATYTLGSADVGKRIRIAVTAEGLGSRTAFSASTGVVTSGSSTPAFPEVPPNSPSPTPTGSPSLLSPFPRIGIAGRARRSSTRLTKFLVRAPRGSRITVRCRGRGCPFRRASDRAGRRAVRFRRLQRSFARGAVIEVFVTSTGKIGKYARFRFRRRKPPSRADGCLQPGARRPSPCP